MKVIDAIREAVGCNRTFFGLEFFPPQTDAAVENLYPRLERMGAAGPLFCGMTWGCGGSTAETTIGIATTAQALLSLEMQVHLTADGATAPQMRAWLAEIKSAGVRNLMVVTGALAPEGRAEGDFRRALDLVRFIRAEYGDHFGIAVAAYPDGHEADGGGDPRDAIAHLKAKVDAGADVIITQMVWSADTFISFCAECQAAGIGCPIVPGIMPIQSHQQFRRWAARSPLGAGELGERLEAARHDDAEVRRIGAEFTTALVKRLMRHGVRGVYFFTMNLEGVVMDLLRGCRLDRGDVARTMPWRESLDTDRNAQEEVRPIFWAGGRAKSYLAATSAWDEFPNGRWGNTRSPAFGDNTTYHTELLLRAAARQCHWLQRAHTVADIALAFVAFLDGQVTLPWCDPLEAEADALMDAVLKPLNRRGVLTINSQPVVNGAPSTDPKLGWGPAGGYCYQKQYLEFFCSPQVFATVRTVFDAYPSLSCMAIDGAGVAVAGEGARTTAVTWGVFPDREVLQPTIVSAAAFEVWAKEAFAMWGLPFDSASRAPTSPSAPALPPVAPPDVVRHVQSSWVLVNVVDNDFVASPTALGTAVARIVATLPELC